MMRAGYVFLYGAFTFALGAVSQAHATPIIDELHTVNCDNELVISAIGDSIVAGVGDDDNNNRGGYVKRLRRDLSHTTINNLGVTGITTQRLFRRTRRSLTRNDSVGQKLRSSDYIIVDVGRNDYFTHRDPAQTVTMLRRFVTLLRRNTFAVIGVATLLPTTRDYQMPFVLEVNQRLFRSASAKFPIQIRFDLLGPSLISSDGIHPSSEGFARMTDVVSAYLSTTADALARLRGQDADRDSLSNFCENQVLHTDAQKADTDGDGLTDGDEVYLYVTSPLKGDSDGDGVADGAEITAGTDPNQ